jgi:hypothetical protein
MFLILAATKKSLPDVAVCCISISSDRTSPHRVHSCLFHIKVSFFLAEQEILFISPSGSIEMVTMNIRIHEL